jgi:hypothetical protein
MTEDHAYFVCRAEEHRRLAVEAGTTEAKVSHLKLGEEYAAKAAKLCGGTESVAEGAALKPGETDPSNIDQTRSAGSDSIRDRDPKRDWDKVDEESDESFPASDPPSIP